VICAVSVAAVPLALWATDAWGLSPKLLHRWFAGTFTIFAAIVIVMLFGVLRGPLLRRPALVILVSMAIAYPAGFIAYLVYFALYEPGRLSNALSQLDLISWLKIAAAGPTILMAWLFSGVAGLLASIIIRKTEA
jgi:hypothetical protein